MRVFDFYDWKCNVRHINSLQYDLLVYIEFS